MRLAGLLALIILIFTGGHVTAAEIAKLENGLTIVYKYIPNIKLVSVQTWVKTGSVNEDERINGISHFLEHMVFKGTEKFEPGEIDLVVDSGGGSMNAATSKDYTFYYVTIPVFNADVAFDVISQMVFKAKFLSDEIEKEKPVVVQEIKRRQDSPTTDMWDSFSEIAFEGTPYSRPVIGTEETVTSFTREDLVDYYDRFYHPENMSLVVAGDISKEDAVKLAEKYFNTKREVGAGHIYDKEKIIQPKENITKIFSKKINQEYGFLAYSGKGLKNGERYALEVLSEVLTGGEFSIIVNRVKNEKKLATGVDAGYMGFRMNGAYVFTYVGNPGSGEKVEAEIMDIIHSLKNLVTDEMIVKAKNRLKSQQIFQRERASSEANDIGFSYTLDIPEYYHSFIENIDKIDKKILIDAADKLFSGKYIFMKTVPEQSVN